MTTEQQDIAVFEFLGWKYLPPIIGDSTFIVRPENLPRWKNGRRTAYKDDIPSYGTDLNACREFEVVLAQMPDIHVAGVGVCSAIDIYEDNLLEICDHPIRATAAKRCEAFLKTINKWKND
jgi:hypothetical protein